MNTKKSGCGFLSIAGLVAAAIIGGVGGYAYKQGWHQLLIGQNLTPLSGAKVIPDEAIMTSFISTDRKHWQQLENLGIDTITTEIQQATSEIEKELAVSNINYQSDIKPWLGNAMLAIVPDDKATSELNVLLVLGIKNPLNAYKFLKKVETSEKDNLTSVNYKGIKINISSNQQSSETNIALLGNKIAISDDIVTVKQAIDTYKSEASFASKPDNKEALKTSFNLKNELIKFYITNYDRLLQNTFAASSLEEKNLTNLQPLESIVFGLGTEEKQLSVQSFTTLKDNIKIPESKPISNKISGKFPPSTIALINGRGISQFWSTMVSLSEQDRELQRILKGVRTSTKWVTGLDLDRDIFSWMDGEFAIGIFSTEQAMIPEINLKLGTAIILETSDRNTAENTLDTIKDKVQQQTGISSSTKKNKKETITQWEVPYSDLDISYGWLDKNNLLLTVGNDAFYTMSDRSQGSLQKSSNYQKITKKLPNKNLSYFYLDMEKIITALQAIPNLPLEENSESMMVLKSIQGISAASVMTDSQTTKSDFIVLFK